MPFIRRFHFDTDKTRPFPFNIPAVRYAKNLDFDHDVIILVGDNGCGKSTLLECIALHCQLPLMGGFKFSGPDFAAAQALKPYIELEWRRQTSRGFFFRAEDFSDFISGVERGQERARNDLNELRGVVDDAIIEQMAGTANYALKQMRKDYGDDMQAYSHGEAYLKILQTQIEKKAIYLLDEPEAALSPLKQLALMAFIMGEVKNQGSQFIIATHAPILMGIPAAKLYQITDDGMEAVAYTETDHYRVTKTFLERPETYLRHF